MPVRFRKRSPGKWANADACLLRWASSVAWLIPMIFGAEVVPDVSVIIQSRVPPGARMSVTLVDAGGVTSQLLSGAKALTGMLLAVEVSSTIRPVTPNLLIRDIRKGAGSLGGMDT